MQTNLDQLVSAQLVVRKGDWLAIAREAGVSYSWLSKFVNGHIKNPGYATLSRLHTTLAQSMPKPTQTPAAIAQPATENVAGQGA